MKATIKQIGTCLLPVLVAAIVTSSLGAQDNRSPELRAYPRPLTASFNNQPPKVMYEAMEKMAGIKVTWADDAKAQSGAGRFTVQFSQATLQQALDKVASATNTSWKATSETSVSVTSR